MPCLNEARTLKKCIMDAQGFLRRKHISGEVIVVNNDSTDESATIAKKYGARVIREKRRGYGRALRTGFKAARGEYIIMGDCDRTYDFAHMTRMWKKMQTCDLVVGDRFKAYQEKGAMSLSHKIGVKVLSWLGRRRFKTNVYDFHCGIRGMRRSAIERLKFRTTGMEFATEMIALASLNGLRIKQIPVDYLKSVKGRRPKLHTIRDGFRHLDYIYLGRMKPIWREFWRLLFILFLSVSMGLGLLWAVAQIPQSAIKQKTTESVLYYKSFDSMKPNLVEGLNNTKMDFYADSIWLSIAYGFDGSLRSVIESKYAYTENADQSDNLQRQLDGELPANLPYARYWHGSLVLIRPLLTFMNVSQIYTLNGLILIGLLMTIIIMLCWHREFAAVGIFAASMIISGAFFASTSLEYIQVFIVMSVITILALKFVWKSKLKQLAYLFFVAGIITNYLDFLTAETLTLTVPLLLVLWLSRKNINSMLKFRRFARIIPLWAAGYVVIWAAKWLIAWIVLGNGIWSDVGTQIGVRSLGTTENFSYIQLLSYAIIVNAESLFPICFGRFFGLATAALMVFLIIFTCLKRKHGLNWFWIVLVIFVAMVPVLRALVLAEHEARHYFFTYRALAGVVMAFLMLCFNTIDWKRIGKKTSKNIV